jgi:hypothetical protein
MPQIGTWSQLPQAIRDHLVERMRDRKISIADLNQLRIWIDSKPNVPEAAWYKDLDRSKSAAKENTRKRFCWPGRRRRGENSRDFVGISCKVDTSRPLPSSARPGRKRRPVPTSKQF